MSQDKEVGKPPKRSAKLTSRQKAVIEILVHTAHSHPVTVATISEKLKLSTRTILREIPAIEQWFLENEFTFIRKPGVGLILAEGTENQQLILELLEVETIEKQYSKEERRRLILGELLSHTQPRKAFYFTSKLKISEATLSNDLDYLALWLNQYNATLLRKPGVGIAVVASEASMRQVIANTLYEVLGEKEIIGLLTGREKPELHLQTETGLQERYFPFIDAKTMLSVEEILLSTGRKLHLRYADSAYIALIVHISLAVKRIEAAEKIEMEAEKLERLYRMPEFSVAEEISKRLCDCFSVAIPKEETGFITMHLLSAQIWAADKGNLFCAGQETIRQLVRGMKKIVEQELQVDFGESELLLEDLLNHMPPVISRLTMNVQIKNSQQKTIQDKYPLIYHATQKACVLLQEIVQVENIPASEIAFIAMHFCAAYEKMVSVQKKVKAVVVCPTGIGTSRILAANIAQEFPNIEITDIISALHIHPAALHEAGVDLILSTVELELDFDTVCVSPVLMEEDKIALKKALANRKQKQNKGIPNTNILYKEQMHYITALGSQILRLLGSIRMRLIETVSCTQALISYASSLFATDKEAREEIAQRLLQRESIASSYIKEFQMTLLHCKTKAVSCCCLGFVRLHHAFIEQGNTVAGAIVMLIPLSENPVYTDIMGEVSAAMIENSLLLAAVQTAGAAEISAELEKNLGRFYKKTIIKRLEC